MKSVQCKSEWVYPSFTLSIQSIPFHFIDIFVALRCIKFIIISIVYSCYCYDLNILNWGFCIVNHFISFQTDCWHFRSKVHSICLFSNQSKRKLNATREERKRHNDREKNICVMCMNNEQWHLHFQTFRERNRFVSGLTFHSQINLFSLVCCLRL